MKYELAVRWGTRQQAFFITVITELHYVQKCRRLFYANIEFTRQQAHHLTCWFSQEAILTSCKTLLPLVLVIRSAGSIAN